MMPKAFIVPLDGSPFAERAIPVAQALAEQTGGEVDVLTAKWDDEPKAAQKYLESVAAAHAPMSSMFVQDRRAAEAIVLAAQARDDRIVCMTSHGRGPLRWSFLGSVAEEVIRESRRPTLVVGRHCALDWPGGFRTAVLPLDGSNAADPVVPVAIDWAQQLGLRVRVVQVIHPLDVEDAMTPNKAIAATIDELRAHDLDVSSVLLRSRLAAHAISDEAATVPGPLVMMSSHSRTGAARAGLGSVAMGVVATSPAPVLVTHPA